MKLVVGLGNPGSQYEHTRHNIGFRVVDALIADMGARNVSKTSFFGELYKAADLLLLKPQTYMNASGKSVAAVKQFYKIDLDDIIVIHDDIDLPFGAVKFKKGGGHGGHNGLKSIDAAIGNAYIRVRIGVGRPQRKTEVASFVLSPFSPEETICLDILVDHAKKAVEALINRSLTEVQTRYTLKSIEVPCR